MVACPLRQTCGRSCRRLLRGALRAQSHPLCRLTAPARRASWRLRLRRQRPAARDHGRSRRAWCTRRPRTRTLTAVCLRARVRRPNPCADVCELFARSRNAPFVPDSHVRSAERHDIWAVRLHAQRQSNARAARKSHGRVGGACVGLPPLCALLLSAAFMRLLGRRPRICIHVRHGCAHRRHTHAALRATRALW